MSAYKCPSCGNYVLDEDAYCENCGVKLLDKMEISDEKYCPDCGNLLEPDAIYCIFCGVRARTKEIKHENAVTVEEENIFGRPAHPANEEEPDEKVAKEKRSLVRPHGKTDSERKSRFTNAQDL